MAENTKIQWCDHSASPWYGCAHAPLAGGGTHPGCDNCYAEALAKCNPATLGQWGEGGTRVKSRSFAKFLRSLQKQRAASGTTTTVFPSLCDPFEDRPEFSEWRREMFAVIDECPNVTLLLLTKRPENVSRMWPLPANGRDPGDPLVARRDNVWLLTSVSDQATADAMTPELLKCRELTPVLGLSCEPLLGPIDLTPWLFSSDGFVSTPDNGPIHRLDGGAALDWIIVGGESGPNARPCNIDWIRSIRDQCRAAGVSCFVKQLGSHVIWSGTQGGYGDGPSNCWPRSTGSFERGDGATWRKYLCDKKGGDWAEWPADLRVRELPRVESEANP